MNTPRLWPVALFLILGLYGSVYLSVELGPSIGHQITFDQTASVLVTFTLLIASGFLLRALSLKNILRFAFLLGSIGVILSGFMTYAHFHSASSFCPAQSSGPVACDIVNQSYYAEILGIPVALMGLGFYALIAILAATSLYQYDHLKQKRLNVSLMRPWLLFLALMGVAFTLWLNYVQFFVLFTLCALCELSATTILLLLFTSIIALRKEK